MDGFTYHPSFCVSIEMWMSLFSFSVDQSAPPAPLQVPLFRLFSKYSPRSSMAYTSAAIEEALRWPFLTSSAVALTKLSVVAESTLDSSVSAIVV